MAKKRTFTLSTEDVNSYGIKVVTAGIKLETFLTNPIMLYMHQRGNVIGGWQDLRVENSTLIGDADFDEEDSFAANIARKVDKNFLRAVSIGVTDFSYHFEKFGDSEIMVIDSCELYEVSVVDVPANRSALRLYDNNRNEVDLSKGLVQFKSSLAQSPKPENVMDLKAMAKLLGLSDSATEEEIQGAIKLAKKATEDLVSLQQKQADDQKKKALKLVDEAITQKRLNATKKETFLKLAETDFDLFESTLEALPAPVSLKNVAQGTAEVPGSISLSEERKKWSFEDWRKNDPDELFSMQKENWDAWVALFKAEYGEDPTKD